MNINLKRNDIYMNIGIEHESITIDLGLHNDDELKELAIHFIQAAEEMLPREFDDGVSSHFDAINARLSNHE